MEAPINPISTRFEDSKYPEVIDSSVKTELPYNPITSVLNLPKKSEEPTPDPSTGN